MEYLFCYVIPRISIFGKMADKISTLSPSSFLSRWGWLLLGGEASGLAALLFHQNFLLQKILHWSWLAQLALYFLLLIISFSLLFLILFLLVRQSTEINPLELTLCFSPLCLAHGLWLGHFYFLHEFRPVLTLSILWGVIFTLVIIHPWPGLFPPLKRIAQIWSNLKPKTLAVILFGWLLVIYNIISLGLLTPSHPLTGDEPHYLLITTSLLQDQDTDLANNFQNQDYLIFYPGKLTPHTYPGRRKDSAYSRHGPGLPLLLLPTFALAQKIGPAFPGEKPSRKIIIWFSRWPITLFSALLVSLFFLVIVNIFKQKTRPYFLAFFFGLSPPLIFYSHLIYPEIPAALILLVCFWIWTSGKRTPFLLWKIFIGSLGLAFLPWLGVKYIPLSITGIIILGVYSLNAFREQMIKRSPALAGFFIPLVVSAALLVLHTWKLYASFSPVSFYRGTSPGEHISQFFHFSLLEFLRCGIGYFFDQRAGLLPYNFIFFLTLAGILILIRTNSKIFLPLLALLASYWGFTSLGYYWGGYCPPGRTLLPLIWIGWLLVTAVVVHHRPLTRLQKAVFLSLLILTLLVTGVTLTHPQLLYHLNLSFPFNSEGLVSRVLQALSNHFIDFTQIVPHLSNSSLFNPWVLVTWMIILGAITIVFRPLIRSAKVSPTSQMSRLHQIFLFLSTWMIIGLVSLYAFFDIHLEKIRSEPGQPWVVYAQDNNSFGPEEGGLWVRGKSKADFLLLTPDKIFELKLKLSAPVAMTVELKQGFTSQKVKLLPQKPQEIILPGTSLVFFPWKKEFFYPLTVKTNHGFYPFRLNRASTDRRWLGVFLRIIPLEK